METWYYVSVEHLANAVAALKMLNISFVYEDTQHLCVILFLRSVFVPTMPENNKKLLRQYGYLQNTPPNGLIQPPSSDTLSDSNKESHAPPEGH